jgi:hypothetical protein
MEPPQQEVYIIKSRARKDASKKTIRTNKFAFRHASKHSFSRVGAALPKDIENMSKIHDSYTPIDFSLFSRTDCCLSAKSHGNHYMPFFRLSNGLPDLNGACAVVLKAREKIRHKSDEELMLFLSEEHDRCKECDPLDPNKITRMRWDISGIPLCR